MVQPSDGLLSSGFRGWGSGLQTQCQLSLLVWLRRVPHALLACAWWFKGVIWSVLFGSTGTPHRIAAAATLTFVYMPMPWISYASCCNCLCS
jgi:hypothetical protein